MNLPKRLYLVFLLSVFVPGILLAYLSFRTIKDERILIERSLEIKNEEFVEELQRLLERTREAHLARLQDQLRRSSSTVTPDNQLLLATDLLENPLIHSLVIYRQEKMVFPRPLRPSGKSPGAEGGGPEFSPDGRRDYEAKARLIREEYRQGRPAACLRLIRALSRNPDGPAVSPLGTPYDLGFRLLELKCLTRLGRVDEAVSVGRLFILDILEADSFLNYHQMSFYLSETISLLTSLENLPRETRDYLWSIYQRSEIYLVNAQYVLREWKASPEHLIRFQGQDMMNPIQIAYLDGLPYLVIGYPWLEKETRVIARLNETVFVEAVRMDVLASGKGPWRDVKFAVFDQRDRMVVGSDAVEGRETALERQLSREFPAWKVAVFKKKESEVAALGRRKILLLYTLLAFSLLALLLGSLSLFMGLRNERRIVRMKTNFLSAVSHELKTPLTSIRMFAEILESGRQPAEQKRRRYAQMIGEESIRLHGMIEDILNFTRLEEKRSQWSFADVNLTTLVQEVAGLISGAYEKAGIRLELRLDTDVHVRGDYDALRSVVQNLLENSLKYSRPETTVILALRGQEDRVVLKVKDQGIGISASDAKHIFEKFYRGGDEMTRKTKGSGLGLAIVKQILDAHRAAIRAVSRPGEGTEMIITFEKGKR